MASASAGRAQVAEAGTSPFVMHGARAALAAGCVHIEQQINAIESAVVSNAGLAFDLAKTLLESICKAVLSERKIAHDDGWDLPRLLKETTRQVQLVPAGVQGGGPASASLRKMVGGLQTAIQGICELRNSHGFASHGKDPSFQQLESVQALLVARAADAIVHFLFHAHWGDGAVTPPREPAYQDHPAFNEHVDGIHDLIRIFDVEFRPSQVLFEMEPESYRIYLAEFEPDLAREQTDDGGY